MGVVPRPFMAKSSRYRLLEEADGVSRMGLLATTDTGCTRKAAHLHVGRQDSAREEAPKLGSMYGAEVFWRLPRAKWMGTG
jgi:hypothetical protein